MTAHVCGIDLGKTVFHLVGLSKEGHIVVKKRFSRKQLLTCTANMPVCLIGMWFCLLDLAPFARLNWPHPRWLFSVILIPLVVAVGV